MLIDNSKCHAGKSLSVCDGYVNYPGCTTTFILKDLRKTIRMERFYFLLFKNSEHWHVQNGFQLGNMGTSVYVSKLCL